MGRGDQGSRASENRKNPIVLTSGGQGAKSTQKQGARFPSACLYVVVSHAVSLLGPDCLSHWTGQELASVGGKPQS